MRRILFVSLAMLVGCGGSSPTVDDVCNPEDGLFQDVLGKTVECQPLAGLLFQQVTAAELANLCEVQVGSYVEDGSTSVGSGSTFDACRDFLATATCDQLNDRNLTNPCNDIVVGQVAVGGVCEEDEQCAGESYCDQPSPPSCGFCVARRADGMNCVEADECLSRRCAGTTNTCQPLLGLNGTCQNTGDCASPYVCNGTSMLCEAAPTWALGTQCTPGGIGGLLGQCNFPNMYCGATGTTTGECMAWVEVGGTCSTDFALNMNCRAFEYQTCQDNGGFKCVAATIVNVGEVCDFDTGRKCAEGLQCGDHDNMGTTADQCYTPLAENAACSTTNDLCDVPLDCENGTCKYGDYSGSCPAPTP